MRHMLWRSWGPYYLYSAQNPQEVWFWASAAKTTQTTAYVGNCICSSAVQQLPLSL